MNHISAILTFQGKEIELIAVPEGQYTLRKAILPSSPIFPVDEELPSTSKMIYMIFEHKGKKRKCECGCTTFLIYEFDRMETPK